MVVNALEGSPWGTFTIAATMPIAMFMGLYLRYWRPGKVLECSAIGFVLVLASVSSAGSGWRESATLAPMFTLSAMTLAIAIIIYGFLASALPVWLLLAPRDYLSTFVKLGRGADAGVGISVRAARAADAGVHAIHRRHRAGVRRQDLPVLLHHDRVRRDLRLPRADLVGHHAEDDRQETHAWPVGYGSMLLESFVAIMALIAACSLQPGVYFAVNSPAGIVGATPEAAVATISGWGFPVTRSDMAELAQMSARRRCSVARAARRRWRSGWRIFSRVAAAGEAVLGFWYHFAIMFEALFILTIIDAGTRVGRFMLQDLLGTCMSRWAGPAGCRA